MSDVVLSGAELHLIVRIEPDGVLSVEWDKQEGRRYLFHDGWSAVLVPSGNAVELRRLPTFPSDLYAAGHAESLLEEPING